jgi:formylglycine-generating enzyme required for sulfatase activity
MKIKIILLSLLIFLITSISSADSNPSLAFIDTLPFSLPVMVQVQGGTFMMGDSTTEQKERPVHAVSLNSFQLANMR